MKSTNVWIGMEGPYPAFIEGPRNGEWEVRIPDLPDLEGNGFPWSLLIGETKDAWRPAKVLKWKHKKDLQRTGRASAVVSVNLPG